MLASFIGSRDQVANEPIDCPVGFALGSDLDGIFGDVEGIKGFVGVTFL